MRQIMICLNCPYLLFQVRRKYVCRSSLLVIGGFPAQVASNSESVSMEWRHIAVLYIAGALLCFSKMPVLQPVTQRSPLTTNGENKILSMKSTFSSRLQRSMTFMVTHNSIAPKAKGMPHLRSSVACYTLTIYGYVSDQFAWHIYNYISSKYNMRICNNMKWNRFDSDQNDPWPMLT